MLEVTFDKKKEQKPKGKEIKLKKINQTIL